MTDPLLDLIANKCLDEDFAGDYDGDDLVNSLLILQQVAHSLAWYKDEEDNLSMDDRCKKAAEFGKALRQSVINFTGLDPAQLVEDMGSEVVDVSIQEK
jgi:hypothetical protein